MKIELGMKFKGCDLKYGAVFSVGRAMFERCDITLIEQNEDS